MQGQATSGRQHAGASEAGLDVGVVGVFPALKRLAPEWMVLWSRAEAPLPFTHPGWLLAWWQTLGGGALRVFTGRADGRLVAVLPMFIYRDGGVSRIFRQSYAGTTLHDNPGLAQPENRFFAQQGGRRAAE